MERWIEDLKLNNEGSKDKRELIKKDNVDELMDRRF